MGGAFPPPNPNPTAGPSTGPKIAPTPFHKGASPSSPAQLGELIRLAEVNASTTIADRKPKPIPGTSCLGRHCDDTCTSAYCDKFRLFHDVGYVPGPRATRAVVLGDLRSRHEADSPGFDPSARGARAGGRESKAPPRH